MTEYDGTRGWGIDSEGRDCVYVGGGGDCGGLDCGGGDCGGKDCGVKIVE